MPTLFRRTPYLLSAVALLGALLIAGCGGGPAVQEETAAEPSDAPRKRVETLVVAPTPFENAIELTGTIESLNDARLSAQSSGTVEYIAPLGARVNQGEAVLRVDQDLAQAAVAQAEANVATAQANFNLAEDRLRRQKPLYQDSIISALEFQNVQAQYNQAKAQLEQAQAGLTQAQKQLENTTLNAPFSGTIEEHFIEEGEQIAPGTAALRIVNRQRMRVRTGVPERYASNVETGTEARIVFDSYGLAPRAAPVTFVGGAIDPQSRTFPIEIALNNPDGTLKPEMVTRLVLPLEQIDDALVIPRTAVLRSEDGNSVFVVNRTDSTLTAERRPVTLGASYAERVVVRDGLQPNDEVVVLGQTDLTRGDPVQVTQRYTSIEDATKTFNDSAVTAASSPRTP